MPVVLVALTLLGASPAQARPATPVTGVFSAHGIALHAVPRFALLVKSGNRTVVVSFNVFGGTRTPHVLAPPREMHDLEVIVFATRRDAARAIPLYTHNPLAAAFGRGIVVVIYDRHADPALVRRARAAVHDLPK
jgi:hypothetical protein